MKKSAAKKKLIPKSLRNKPSTNIKESTNKGKLLPNEDPNIIIKWNLPMDILIEILALVEDREFKYLTLFDKRCGTIITNDDLCRRLMVRRVERKINPSLS